MSIWIRKAARERLVKEVRTYRPDTLIFLKEELGVDTPNEDLYNNISVVVRQELNFRYLCGVMPAVLENKNETLMGTLCKLYKTKKERRSKIASLLLTLNQELGESIDTANIDDCMVKYKFYMLTEAIRCAVSLLS